jgi:hypothetical protein
MCAAHREPLERRPKRCELNKLAMVANKIANTQCHAKYRKQSSDWNAQSRKNMKKAVAAKIKYKFPKSTMETKQGGRPHINNQSDNESHKTKSQIYRFPAVICRGRNVQETSAQT